jgi:hypothetical protein
MQDCIDAPWSVSNRSRGRVVRRSLRAASVSHPAVAEFGTTRWHPCLRTLPLCRTRTTRPLRTSQGPPTGQLLHRHLPLHGRVLLHLLSPGHSHTRTCFPCTLSNLFPLLVHPAPYSRSSRTAHCRPIMSHLQYFNYPGVGERNAAAYNYSQAVRVGDRIECSGQGRLGRRRACRCGQLGRRLRLAVCGLTVSLPLPSPLPCVLRMRAVQHAAPRAPPRSHH